MGLTPYAGQTIRDLRRARRMTGEELGKLAGLSQPKISKIETGSPTPLNRSDIEKILDILEASQTIRQQILGSLGQATAPSTRRLKAAFRFEWALELERAAATVRAFSMDYIPALLQTLEYRRAILSHIALCEDEIQAAMRAINRRQDLLWEKQRRYHFIIHEPALYTTPADHPTQIAQLDRVERFVGVHSIRIGIIPLEAGLIPGLELAPFVLYDTLHLVKVAGNVEPVSDSSADIAEHLKIFAALERKADYGDSARTLVRKAIDYFS